MKIKAIAISLLIFTTSAICGCLHCQPVDPQQQLIMQFDDYMIPLSKAVDVIADTLPPDAMDRQIFDEVVRRSGNPNLIKPFDGYVLKARIENGVGVILLCSLDEKQGIIEDVSCTARIDMHRPSGSPCVYMLDIKRVCSTP
jgi:hypothetical protein